jgi:hypothetical protein
VSRVYEMCGDAKPMFGEDRRLEASFAEPPEWDGEELAYGEPRRRYAS